MFKKKRNAAEYIVLTEHHLYKGDSLKDIEKQSGLSLSEDEFRLVDGTYIVNMNAEAIDFVIDKRRMANIPWQSLIKKDMTINYMMYAMLALLVIILLRG